MEIIYSGKDVKRLLSESIPGYKPVVGGNASTENEKINKASNKDSITKTKIKNVKNETSPVKDNSNQSTDIGNNKNMLDLQFDNEPDEKYIERVKKQVTGDDSEFGNKSIYDDDTKGNKAFYNAAKNATKNFVDKRQDLENSGLTGKNLKVSKKNTAFEENTHKNKIVNFKNTKFYDSKHMYSLIPEEYKKDGNVFIMRDKTEDEYLIEWRIDSVNKISEGTIVKHDIKEKTNKELDRIKNLYEYKSNDNVKGLSGKKRQAEDSKISEVIKKIKDLTDN